MLQSFRQLAMTHNNNIPREELQKFVQTYFQSVGQELLPWIPEDWKERCPSGEKAGQGSSLGAASLNTVVHLF